MKRNISAIVGIILMLAMAFSLAACHRNAEEAESAAPTVVTQAVAENTTAANAEQTTAQATETKADAQKTTKKAAEKTTKKAAEKTTKKATQKTTEKATEATGSPVQRFQGTYGNGRCTIKVIPVANNTVDIHVYWSSSAWEHSEWTMSGNFDEDSKDFDVNYSDGVRKDYKYSGDGSEESVETIYTGGKGVFRFNGNKLTWDDQAEHVADGMVFTK